MRNTGKRLLEIVNVSFECLSAIGDGAGANPFDRGRLSGSPCNRRSPFIIFGKGLIFA
jgi:hypothetical protein